MLRWIFYFAMLFISRRGAAAVPTMGDVVQSITEKIQTALVTALAGFFLLLMSMGGFIMTLFVLAQQYDRDGVLSWSATLAVAIALLTLPLVVLLMSGLRLKQSFRPAPAAAANSGLPKAIEELAVEWLKDQMDERRARRDQARRENNIRENATNDG